MRRLAPLAFALALLSIPSAEAASVRRLAGEDRYATAAAVTLDRWSSVSDVFLAGSADPADALAGSFGSGLHVSPLLLTERDSLPAATLDALRALDPSRVRLLGGTATIGAEVVAALEAEGWAVQRYAGADRFGTAAAVARSEGFEAIGSWRSEGRTALLANGHRPFDALAAGPLAAGQQLPILLTETDVLPSVTSKVLDDLEIAHVIVLGGTGAVSDAVLDRLESSGRTVRRVAGVDRMATAVAVAELIEELDYDVTRAALTSASSPFDALGAGPWAAPATPILLCETPSFCGAATTAYVKTRVLDEVVVIGGTAAVSDAAALAVATP